MSFLYSLCSSSKGNSTYIGDTRSGILIDAGIGIRAFNASLSARNISPDSVKAVFITHEHSDHIKGLKSILKATGAVLTAPDAVLKYLALNDYIPANTVIYSLSHYNNENSDFKIEYFSTPHDSIDSVGYSVITPDGKKISICTDLGYMTKTVYSCICDSDLCLLESNYDEYMLDAGEYPYFLKHRIKGRKGHLSNDEAAKTLISMLKDGCCRFILGHLSQNNNLPELAYQNAVTELFEHGAVADRDYTINVAPAANTDYIITEI